MSGKQMIVIGLVIGLLAVVLGWEDSKAEAEKGKGKVRVEFRTDVDTHDHGIVYPEPPHSFKLELPKGAEENWRPGDGGLARYVPSILPSGMQFKKLEHRAGLLRSWYVHSTGGEKEMVLYQADKGQELSEDRCGRVYDKLDLHGPFTSQTGLVDQQQWLICYKGISLEEVHTFAQSLFPYRPPVPGNPVRFTQRFAGDRLGDYRPDEREFHVFSSPSAWNAWIDGQEVASEYRLEEATQAIIAASFAGTRGSPGYTIYAAEVREQDGVLNIVLRESQPSSDVMIMVVTHPYEVISIAPDQDIHRVQFMTPAGEAVASFGVEYKVPEKDYKLQLQ